MTARNADHQYEPSPRHNIVGWVAHHLPRAIEFADRERASIERARRYHHAAALRRGTCSVGHRLDEPTPTNLLGTAPCGYCENTKGT